MSRVLRALAKLLPEKQFINEGEVYFRRYTLLSCRWFSLFLHEFETRDRYPELHDHPNGPLFCREYPEDIPSAIPSAVSVILCGGYVEEKQRGPGQPVTFADRRAGSVAWMYVETRHRVEQVHRPCWTLFLTGPFTRAERWGFYDKDTNAFTPWLKFLTERSCST